MPSYNEGGPRVSFGSDGLWCACFSNTGGIVPGIIKDKESGRIVDWNADDIAVKANELLSNTEEYDKYRQVGFEIVKQFEKESR